jgi:hypothetical protein
MERHSFISAGQLARALAVDALLVLLLVLLLLLG